MKVKFLDSPGAEIVLGRLLAGHYNMKSGLMNGKFFRLIRFKRADSLGMGKGRADNDPQQVRRPLQCLIWQVIKLI